MQLTPLPAFADNYIWLLEHQRQMMAVDPGDAQAVLQWLTQQEGLQLTAILVTHHHADHTGGLQALVQATGAQVYGPALEKLPVPHTPVTEGDLIAWGPLQWRVIDVPGHTAGHVAYWAQPDEQAPLLFCGDTLFSGGCGRVFEGSPAQMLDSLDRLAALPGDTRVCCAHEYTLSNLRFALAVEPNNPRLKRHQQHCQALRAQNLPTLPSPLAQELEINPFLRSRLPAMRHVIASAIGKPTASDAEAFAQLREWKNQFK